MKLTTLEIKILNSQYETIYLPSFIIKKLQIPINKKIPIYFGLNSKRMVLIKEYKTNKNVIIITTALKSSLLLPFKKSIMIKKEKHGLRIGPIIGVFTTDLTGKKFSNTSTLGTHPQSHFFKNLLSLEQNYPIFYFVFTPENIDWTKNTITGYFLKKNSNGVNTWQKIIVPFPDVVYNRIPNRTTEKLRKVNLFKERYRQLGGQLFNSQFFDKWEMYKILKTSPKCIDYLPETYLNPRYETFYNMVKKYSITYLKPANGSLGLGIYKIINSGTSYILKYHLNSRNTSLTFNKVSSIYKYIFSNKNPRNYLVQQGIDLTDYNKAPVDFRVHLNKDRNNDWKVVAIGAKAAGKESVTTHLRTGGKLLDSNSFLKYKFNNEANRVMKKLNSISIQIAQTVEEKTNKPLGELGLDIGIDKQQFVWLFEVNSKPGRSIFNHPKLKSAGKESSKELINYAIYLAKFTDSNSINKEGYY